MCHSPDDKPLIRSISGASSSEGALVLTSADGTRFDGFSARAERPSGAGVVVLPDNGGLSDFYRELARRFAAEGIDAVTIDYYGRTSGLGPRPPDFNSDEHMERTRPATVDADVQAAVRHLRSPDGGAVRKVFTVGFCFGGAASWRQAAHGVDGAIGFYGSGEALRTTVSDLRTLKAPLLLLIAESDPYFPIADSRQIIRELEAAGVEHQAIVYDGAPHGFFSSQGWAEACEDSWSKVLEFIRRNTRPASDPTRKS